MSNAVDSDETPIVSVQQLADYIATGCKDRAAFRIGTEHEKFLFDRNTLKPLSYHGNAGVGAVLQRLCAVVICRRSARALSRSAGRRRHAYFWRAVAERSPGGIF